MNAAPIHRRDPLYVAARLILRRLTRPSPRRVSRTLKDAVCHLLHRQEILQHKWTLLLSAEQRGWDRVAQRLATELLRDGEFIRQHIDTLPAPAELNPEDSTDIELSFRPLIGDLRQLSQEFEGVEFRLRQHQIIARIESIELDGIHLGPFAIELDLDRLRYQVDSSSFRCVALEPNPASSNDAVTHPHVKDGGLCAGEATAPIASALRQGRICDAFCLVRAVLLTYNPHSPYVALGDWDGVRCSDCDRYTGRDDLYYCEHCGHDVCDQCYGGCELCDHSCCGGCLETDEVSGRRCCPDCRHTCAACGRTVDADDFNEASGLCPGCQQEAEQTKSITQTELEITDAEPIELPQERAGERVTAA